MTEDSRTGAPGYEAPSDADKGRVEGGQVRFPEWRGTVEPPSAPPPTPTPPGERIGFAIVALGRISVEQVLPAFGECLHARATALVTSDVEKGRVIARQYGIPDEAVFAYADTERLRERSDVRAAYIGLPNGMHREYTERLAAIGLPVLCEKPMANTPEEAEAMVAACAKDGVPLMIAYRCQYEPFHLAARKMVESGELGRLRFVEATNVQSGGGADQWRYSGALAGGGALPDIGLYCLNSTRFLVGEEPESVTAMAYSPPGDKRWERVEESMAFTLRFPSGVIASCLTSYGVFNKKSVTLHFEAGTVEVEDAFSYHGARFWVTRRDGDVAMRAERKIGAKNHFAQELDHFAVCVRDGTPPKTPGEEGLRDQRIMAALYQAAAEARPIPV
ncbi:Gfo/Idh/MocA family oxidoreductase [Roseomonas sp. CCTCC AB2023176]|uniref:Gfo/Idh/MocA family protein n=1 Tax=Roseomonas sp. CCTCC AB2023176 TaxID=3342640 RepID=UPI0035DF53BD